MARMAPFNRGNPSSFPVRAENIYWLLHSDIVSLLLKSSDGRDRIPNFLFM